MAKLSQIIDDLKEERTRLDMAIQALIWLDGTAPKAVSRRTVSAIARKRMAAAQKASAGEGEEATHGVRLGLLGLSAAYPQQV